MADLPQPGMDPQAPIFIRIFKEESELEVWKLKSDGRFYHFKTYPICNWSGELGPKLKAGDRQAPEGFYTISREQMNPDSKYHLAMAYALVIGSKNVSSWSLRPWLALVEAGIPFREVSIPLRRPETKAEILRHSPAGHVPILIWEREGRRQPIWDSLAILEFLAESHGGGDLRFHCHGRGFGRLCGRSAAVGVGPLQRAPTRGGAARPLSLDPYPARLSQALHPSRL